MLLDMLIKRRVEPTVQAKLAESMTTANESARRLNDAMYALVGATYVNGDHILQVHISHEMQSSSSARLCELGQNNSESVDTRQRTAADIRPPSLEATVELSCASTLAFSKANPCFSYRSQSALPLDQYGYFALTFLRSSTSFRKAAMALDSAA